MGADMKGMVAIATGASRGIGRSIALELAGHGADVVLAARKLDQLNDVKLEIEKNGGKAQVVSADITREKDVVALFQRVGASYGRLDILVNNAGIGIQGKLVDFPVEQFDRIMEINARGLYLCCQQAMRMMIPQKKGYIFNISSIVGFRGYAGQSAYGASKHAVMGITKALAVEAQEHGICVSAILPGVVDTDMAHTVRPDLDRSVLIPPEDIAKVVVFLLSLSPRSWIDEIYIRRRASAPF